MTEEIEGQLYIPFRYMIGVFYFKVVGDSPAYVQKCFIF